MFNKNLNRIVGAGLLIGLGFVAASFNQIVSSQQQGDRRQADVVIAGMEGNHWLCEPLVVFDVSGATLLGPVHRSMILYNNGRVSVAEFAPGKAPRNASRMISIDEAERLHGALVDCGALDMLDQKEQVMDVPMTSISIFTGETDAVSHTFNYWLAGSEYGKVEHTIDRFIRNFLCGA